MLKYSECEEFAFRASYVTQSSDGVRASYETQSSDGVRASYETQSSDGVRASHETQSSDGVRASYETHSSDGVGHPMRLNLQMGFCREQFNVSMHLTIESAGAVLMHINSINFNNYSSWKQVFFL